MKYLNTAFQQLEFAWKLYNYALEGKIDLEELDKPLTFQGGESVFVLQDKIFGTPNDLLLAFENNLTIAFGAAAITLNRCREEAGIQLTNSINTEIDQFAAVAYQIRNCFAHDIAEPFWRIADSRFARPYRFGGIQIDLTTLNSKPFNYSDIGGPEVLVLMKNYGQQTVWPDTTR
jgi:hypothetical protein